MTRGRVSGMRGAESIVVVVLMCVVSLAALASPGSAHVDHHASTLPGGTTANGVKINSYGQVVGPAQVNDVAHGFVLDPVDVNIDGIPDSWYSAASGGGNQLMEDIGSLYASAMQGATWAYGINDDGLVVGFSYDSSFPAHLSGFIINPLDSDSNGIADMWFQVNPDDGSNLLMTHLPDLMDLYGVQAWDINNAGAIVGSTGSKGCVLRTPTSSSWLDIGHLGNFATDARAINYQGWVVGGSEVPGGQQHAFVVVPDMTDTVNPWRSDVGVVNTRMVDLGALFTLGRSFAWDVNDQGTVIGYGYAGGTYHPLKWFQQSGTWTMQDLSTYWPNGWLQGINEQGDIVGYTFSTLCKAALFDRNNNLEFLPDPMDLSGQANSINSRGEIAGNLQGRGCIWAPPQAPIADFTVQDKGNLLMRFDATTSHDWDGAIQTWQWNFGDGVTSSGVIRDHLYTAAGTYTVTLTVTDDSGLPSTIQKDVTPSVVVPETPEEAIQRLIIDIPQCHDANGQPIDDKTEKALLEKAYIALEIVSARKTGGSPQAVEARKTGGACILNVFDSMVESFTIQGRIDAGEGWDLTCEANLAIALLANQVRIEGVPCYNWYHGCGPTAAGMILGYWDDNGYPLLVTGNPGAALTQTVEVNLMIASPLHVMDYALYEGKNDADWPNPYPDLSENNPPRTPHGSDCLADFMETSWSVRGLGYGESIASKVCLALEGYVEYISDYAYVGTATELRGASLTWKDIQDQVNSQHPMAATVDINGDGQTDHLVTVIGYCELGSARLYAFYSTWDSTVWWANFEMMQKGDCFGIYSGFLFDIAPANSIAA